MSLNQLKIGLRLGLGFGAVLALMAMFSLLNINSMERLAEQTQRLHTFSFTLTNAVLRIDGNIAKLGQVIDDIGSLQSDNEIAQKLREVEQYKATIEEDFDLALERFLGDKNEIESARRDYHAWLQSLEKILALYQDRERDIALSEARQRTIEERKALNKRIEWITEFALNKAQEFLNNVKQSDGSEDAKTVTERMYRHPFTVTNAVLRIDGHVGRLRLARYQIQGASAEERRVLEKDIKRYERAINDDFELALERFLGDKTEINKTRDIYTAWHEAIAHEMALLLDTSRQKNLSSLHKTATEERGILNKNLSEFILAAQQRADNFAANAAELKVESINFTYFILFTVLTVSLGLAFWIARSIISPLGKAVNLSRSLAEGKLETRVEITTGRDETTQLLRAMNEMANDLQAVISETRNALTQLAEGKQDTTIEGQFIGDFSEIKDALKVTAKRLAEATEKNRVETWLKTGQAQLNETLSGDQTLKDLAENAINFFTPYLEAQVGALYLLEEEEGGKEAHLRLIATHAYTWRKNANTEYRIGEGIIGQAAYEGKAFVVGQAPAEHMLIDSGLGESAPRSILAIPFKYEDSLKGVMEIATFGSFTQLQLDFLEQSMPILAIAINTAESRSRMRVLLQQSQEQAEQLQKQAAEMEIQQQQLQESNEQMQRQQKELQQANEELQSQSEELQTQSEELRQTNEELELRGRELERQQEAVEKKNNELERAKEAIQNKAEELELASKYKSEFLANMSHELRTPLNSLLILAQLLVENKEGNLSDKQIECARTIHGSGADLLNLINEILDLSKVEAGKIEIQPENVNFEDMLGNLKQKFQHVADEKKVKFAIEQGDKLPAHIYTDAQRLQQIINNLLSNAFKFTERGQVKLTIRRPGEQDPLTRPGLTDDNTIAISVSDTGIGIPEDKQRVIFEAFQQADGTTSRKYGGTGLGLSISRQLVQLMGGEIQLHSEAEQGSEFIVYLPENYSPPQGGAAAVTPHTPPSPKAMAPGESANMTPAPIPAAGPPLVQDGAQTLSADAPRAQGGKLQDDREALKAGDKSLLIVEDDRHFSKILMELAQEKGFKCLVSEDGKNGLALAEQYKPSAIILDIGLPQADGWTVMERLKENPDTRHIPVHFVSGYDHHMDARRMGAIGYSLKPISMAELGEAFKTIEHFVHHTVKNLLIVADESKQQTVLELIGSGQVRAEMATERESALSALRSKRVDVIVVDVSVEDDKGIDLLETLYKDEKYAQIPVVVYAERDLNAAEEKILQGCADRLTVKAVHSPERLLDEATLFLHQVEASLPDEQREMLHRVYDKEAILANKKVLIVDDDMRNSFALATILSQKEMEVLMAANGREALEMLESHPDVNLVLMDIMMPEMDGYEATQAIREQNQFRKLPIIALTAKAMKGDRAKCIEAGANDYLAKPIDTDKLLSLMRVWLYQ